jgi:hypothetical protein
LINGYLDNCFDTFVYKGIQLGCCTKKGKEQRNLRFQRTEVLSERTFGIPSWISQKKQIAF